MSKSNRTPGVAIRRIRPHHGLCSQFFVGMGYSDEFVDNMQSIIRCLNETDPELKLLPGCDSICAHCPNDHGGICRKAELVRGYDMQVLEHCGLTSGCTVRWSDYTSLVRRCIVETGSLSEVCGDCQWYEICESSALGRRSLL